jgi:hypothetical protein
MTLILIIVVVALVVIVLASVLYVRHNKKSKAKQRRRELDLLAQGSRRKSSMQGDAWSRGTMYVDDPTADPSSTTFFANPMYHGVLGGLARQSVANPMYQEQAPDHQYGPAKSPDTLYHDVSGGVEPAMPPGYLDVMEMGSSTGTAPSPVWLVGVMDRDKAESILASRGSLAGDFVVRQSSSNMAFVLSMVSWVFFFCLSFQLNLNQSSHSLMESVLFPSLWSAFSVLRTTNTSTTS